MCNRGRVSTYAGGLKPEHFVLVGAVVVVVAVVAVLVVVASLAEALHQELQEPEEVRKPLLGV